MKSLNTITRIGLVIALVGAVMGYAAGLAPTPQDLSQRFDSAMAEIFLQFTTLGGAGLAMIGLIGSALQKRGSTSTKCKRCGFSGNSRSDRFCRQCGAELGAPSGAAA